MSSSVSTAATLSSRRHHYIPVFYLKQWAKSDGCVCQYSRPHSRVACKRKHPQATGYQDDLYSIEGAPPAIRSYIEDHFLKRTDQLASDALQRFVNDTLEISHDLRSGWTRFIMSLLQRTPQKIAWLLENWARQYNQASNTTEPIARAIMTMRMLQSVMDLPKTGEKINGMIWNVVSYSNPKFNLLTSDRPVIMSDGLLKEDSHIILPIGPQRLFVASNSQAFVERLKSLDDQQLISDCNHAVVWQAHTYAYGEDDSQRRFIENRLGRGKPQLIVRDMQNS